MAIDFDAVLLKVGEFGKYQKLIVFLLCVPACFMNAYGGFGFVFQGYTPSFNCRQNDIHDSNETDEDRFDEKCEYYNSTLKRNETCHQFEYDQTYFESTIITQYSLICDRSIVYKTALSFFSGIAIVGCFVFSIIQDKFGRKKTFFIALTMFQFGNIASIFAPNLLWFTILKVPSSLAALSTWNLGYIWALEFVGPSKRTMVTFIMSFVYGIAAASLGLIAWPCRSWTHLVLATTLPFFLLYSYWFIIDESPRWLVSKGRIEEAEKIILRIAADQNEPVDAEEINQILKRVEDKDGDKDGDKFEQLSTVSQICLLLKESNMRRKTLLITCIWFTVAATYSGIAYNMENLGGNLYISYSLQAAVEIPSTLLILTMLNRYGRVLSLAFAQIVCCSFFAFLSIPAEFLGIWAVIGCTIAVKFGSCLAFAIITQVSSELYPTVLRGSGTGFSSSIGDAGNILMPYIIHSTVAYRSLPLIILGTISLISGIGCLFLPETSGQLLPETVKEAEEYCSVGMTSFRANIKSLVKRKLVQQFETEMNIN